MEASAARSIADSVKELAGLENAFGVVCTVKSVNDSDRLCDCTPVEGGADILEVKLMANIDKGFYVIPKVGSFVIVSKTSPSAGYITMFSEVDEIQLNGDNFDGLTKIGDVVTKLNNLENKVNSVIAIYNAHTHIATGFGIPTAPPVALVVGVLVPTVKADLENTTVKHGDGS